MDWFFYPLIIEFGDAKIKILALKFWSTKELNLQDRRLFRLAVVEIGSRISFQTEVE